MVMRCPNGGGVGGGPYHSENLEAWFPHHAGIKIVCPATAEDAYGLLRSAIRDPNPVMSSSTSSCTAGEEPRCPPAGDGVASARRGAGDAAGEDLTLIVTCASTWTGHEAADELANSGDLGRGDRSADAGPYDEETVLASVRGPARR